MAKFANALFTRMSGLNPAVKFRYLHGGFEVVGDHKQAHEARKVYDYYKDLVTEIKLDAALDGGDDVGHGRPFGLFVNLRHTREIERESGGFGRYLQNQNQGNLFSYNYGRPAGELPRQVPGRRQEGPGGALRGRLGHVPGREGQLEGDRRSTAGA